MIFISAPYSHLDPEVVQLRVDLVCHYAAKLFNEGKVPFSPVIIGHTISGVAKNISVKSSDWEAYSRESLIVCTQVHVLTLPGWEDSSGVANELAVAREYNKPVILVDGYGGKGHCVITNGSVTWY